MPLSSTARRKATCHVVATVLATASWVSSHLPQSVSMVMALTIVCWRRRVLPNTVALDSWAIAAVAVAQESRSSRPRSRPFARNQRTAMTPVAKLLEHS